MLSEQRRTQLDGIVQKMTLAKESDANIKFVVNDFKSKYENESSSTNVVQPEQKKSLFQKASSLADNTFGKASDFLFGSTGKAVGGLITSGIGETMKFSSNPQTKAKGEKLAKVGAEQVTPTNIAFSTLELYPGGGYVSKALRKIPGAEKVAEVLAKVPENLRAKAIKQYSEALGATTNEMKALTKKVVPELLDRGVKTKSLEKLSEKSIAKSDVAGQAIDEFIQKIPEATRMKVKPVIDALEGSKKQFIVDGVAIEPQAVKSATELQKVIAQFGEDISPASLRKVRQVWDKTVAKAGGFVGKTLKEGGEVDLKKVATNSIREELGKEFPDLKKLNAEFALWSNVQKITNATLKRKSSQGKGLSQVISSTVGGGAGFASGDTVGERFKNAFIGAAIGKYAGAFNSPRYKMLSATTKNKLAKIIASGDAKKIAFAMSKIFAALKNSTEKK
jgi:hypothetical protein